MKNTCLLSGVIAVLLSASCDASCSPFNESTSEIQDDDTGNGIAEHLPDQSAVVERTSVVPKERFSEALREEGDALEVLVGALTSRDDGQARQAAAMISHRFGCKAVDQPMRMQLLRQMRTFPTPQGALLLSCIEDDPVVIEVLKSFDPVNEIAWHSSAFEDWETARQFALAEAGDTASLPQYVERIEDGDLQAIVPLLSPSVFRHLWNRDILLALVGHIFDPRRMRPDLPADTDAVNPLISDLVAEMFDLRFQLDVRGRLDRPRSFTEEEKTEVYRRVREILARFQPGRDVQGESVSDA